MELFEKIGWSRLENKVWSRDQGPYLEGLDFFISSPTIKFSKDVTYYSLGVDYQGKQVALNKIFDDWELVVVTDTSLEVVLSRGTETIEMIEGFWNIHPKGTYGYEFSKKEGCRDKIEIICPKHGKFFQTPYFHLKGRGCQTCAQQKNGVTTAVTTEELIRRSKAKFGDLLDYSKVICNGMKRPAIFICKIHGEFSQTPVCHLKGKGCPICVSGGGPRKTTAEFRIQANVVHHNRYGYDNSDYKGATVKLYITCFTHGDFLQAPNDHLRGHGCPKCHSRTIQPPFSLGDEGSKVHNNKYDYSLVVHKDSKTKVIIICPIHGKFLQTPDVHLRGHGCPKCNVNQYSKPKKKFTKRN